MFLVCCIVAYCRRLSVLYRDSVALFRRSNYLRCRCGCYAADSDSTASD